MIVKKLITPLRFKLLFSILPLVCIPIAIVSYLSYNNFVNTFTVLSKDKLMLEAQKYGDNTETIFANAMADLDTIWSIFASDFADYQLEGFFHIQKDFISSILNEFVLRSPYYFQVAFWDIDGTPIVDSYERLNDNFIEPATRKQIIDASTDSMPTISDLVYSPGRGGYLISISKVILDANGKPCVALMLDLDFSRILADLIRDVEASGTRVLIVDKLGRTLYHPEYEPYGFNLLTQEEPSVRNFLVEMLVGYSGWDVYEDKGLQVAAYAPIKTPGWSIALTMSFPQFVKDSENLRHQTTTIVFITIVIVIGVLFLMASRITGPVNRLARATREIKAGRFELIVARDTNDEVGQLTDAFNEMVRSLDETQKKLLQSEKLASMGRFSAGIAHEVRNPLNAMHGAATFLKRKRNEDELVNEYLDLIISNIERLNTFIIDFLFFAQKGLVRSELVDVKVVLRDVVKLFNVELAKTGVVLYDLLGPDDEPVMMKIDVAQMIRVFTNIIVNAVQAMPKGGALSIALNLVPNSVSQKAKLVFTDTGIGIKSGDLANIYDPFFTTKEHGVGLGLPIIMGIVESHHGQIEIHSKEGQGTMVIITLPVA